MIKASNASLLDMVKEGWDTDCIIPSPRRMRNLEELYDTTQVMEDTTLFCFHADKDPPEKKKAIGVKRVYKTKAKLVDKGYKQREGIEGRSTCLT